MHIFIKESNEIYSTITKEYFQEVLSSYENGNYRAAVVMLYSVVLYDIIYKLQELDDMYNDTNAAGILKKLEDKNEDENKSKWEWKLIVDVHNKTELVDDITFAQLQHLKDYRNFCAHPALDRDYKLVSPTKETTLALMINVLENILIKPPIFIKNIVDSLTTDLSEKKVIYDKDIDKLSIYLNNKYFMRMSQTMKEKTFRAFWKLTFIISDNAQCAENRRINRMALEVLTQTFLNESLNCISKEINYYRVSTEAICLWQLTIFLSKFPEIYEMLSSEVKDQINGYTEDTTNNKGGPFAISWFKKTDLKIHINQLKESNINISEDIIDYISNYYMESGMTQFLIDTWIDYYVNSESYNESDKRYEHMIKPYLNKMGKEQIIRLIKGINTNNQVYDRMANKSSCNEIYNIAKDVLDDDFEYSTYRKFEFDKDEIEQDEISINDDDSDLFEDGPF